MSDQERIAALEEQVKLLWECLYRTSRLEGFDNSTYIESSLRQIKPMRFPKEEKNER